MKHFKFLACICAGILFLNIAVQPSENVRSAIALQTLDWGNADCSVGDTPYQRVDVSDAVVLARYLTEDVYVTFSQQGKLNADVDTDGELTTDDVIKILKFVARLIDYDELGRNSK